MRVKFLQNLGSDDARACNKKHGCNIDHKACTIGVVVDLPDEAADTLGRKYPALFEPVNVKGESKKPEITAPAKQ